MTSEEKEILEIGGDGGDSLSEISGFRAEGNEDYQAANLEAMNLFI